MHALELAIHMPGQMIIEQGTKGEEMYFLIQGKCVCHDENDSGSAYNRTMLAGSFFGEIALLESRGLPETYEVGVRVVIVKPGKKV